MRGERLYVVQAKKNLITHVQNVMYICVCVCVWFFSKGGGCYTFPSLQLYVERTVMEDLVPGKKGKGWLQP